MALRKVQATVKPTANKVDQNVAPDAHLDLRVWLKLMSIHKSIKDELGRRMVRQFSTTLARFDMMAHLHRRPEGMRMVELSRLLMVTNGNVTGITDRLEGEGLVLRAVDPENRSAILIRLTPKGKKLFEAIAKEHDVWISELFIGLTQKEKSQLLAALAKHNTALKRIKTDDKG